MNQQNRKDSRSLTLSQQNHAMIYPAVAERKKIASNLENALADNALDVHYQSQIDIKRGVCGHLEALARWTDPELGTISPAAFIPIAEEFGLIDDITRFVIERVKQDLRDWRRDCLPIESVAVNVSAKLLSSSSSAEKLMGWLLSGDDPKGSLTLELTETAMVQHKKRALAYMQLLRELGFQLALDDFGTGYSSLAYLLEFPIDVIKIDRSFISGLTASAKCRTIVQSIIEMSRTLGMKTVAEGVERAEELGMLHKWSCSLVQGFYFSKPIKKDAVAAHVRQWNAAA